MWDSQDYVLYDDLYGDLISVFVTNGQPVLSGFIEPYKVNKKKHPGFYSKMLLLFSSRICYFLKMSLCVPVLESVRTSTFSSR